MLASVKPPFAAMDAPWVLSLLAIPAVESVIAIELSPIPEVVELCRGLHPVIPRMRIAVSIAARCREVRPDM
jgi:hypothetical protein